jgi:hypothetical protein
MPASGPSGPRTSNETPRRHYDNDSSLVAEMPSGDAMTIIHEPDTIPPDLRSVIQEWVGEASMCWTSPPSGIFDSEHARDLSDRIVKELCTRIADELIWMLGSEPRHLEPIRRRINELMRGSY